MVPTSEYNGLVPGAIDITKFSGYENSNNADSNFMNMAADRRETIDIFNKMQDPSAFKQHDSLPDRRETIDIINNENLVNTVAIVPEEAKTEVLPGDFGSNYDINWKL